MENPDEAWFTDGSNFVKNETQKARYAIVSLNRIIEAKALPPSTRSPPQPSKLLRFTDNRLAVDYLLAEGVGRDPHCL